MAIHNLQMYGYLFLCLNQRQAKEGGFRAEQRVGHFETFFHPFFTKACHFAVSIATTEKFSCTTGIAEPKEYIFSNLQWTPGPKGSGATFLIHRQSSQTKKSVIFTYQQKLSNAFTVANLISRHLELCIQLHTKFRIRTKYE